LIFCNFFIIRNLLTY